MNYFVLHGTEKYGPYEDWSEAYFFATINFGFSGWSIWEE